MAKKVIPWLVSGILLLIFVVGLVSIPGFIEKKMNSEIKFSQVAVQFHGFKWGKRWNAYWDSLLINTPNLSIHATKGDLSLKFLKAPWSGTSTATLRIDSLEVFSQVDADTTPIQLDSIFQNLPVIKKIGIPLKVAIGLGYLSWSNDSGMLAIVHGLRVFQPSYGTFRVQSGWIQGKLPGIEPDSIKAQLSWNAYGDALVYVSTSIFSDSVVIDATLPQGKTSLGQVVVQAQINRLERYSRSIHPLLRRAHNYHFIANANLHNLDASIQGGFNWEKKPNMIHEGILDLWKSAEFSVRHENNQFDVSVTLHTPTQGKANVFASHAADSLVTPLKQWQDLSHYAWNLEGRVEKVNWNLANLKLPLDLEIIGGKWEEKKGQITILTSAFSKVKVWADFASTKSPLHLEADIDPMEPWATQWTHGHVQFSRAKIFGEWTDHKLKLSSKILKLGAYGFFGDTLIAKHTVTANTYILEQATLKDGLRNWDIHGQVRWEQFHEGLEFVLRDPDGGSVKFTMFDWNHIHVASTQFYPNRLPFKPVVSYTSYLPTELTGTFAWDMLTNQGSSVMQGFFGFKGEKLDWNFESKWNKDTLYLPNFTVQNRGQSLSAKGTCLVPSVHFYTCFTSLDSQWIELGVSTSGIRVDRYAQQLHLPVGTEALLRGHFKYQKSLGFSDSLELSQIVLPWRKNDFNLSRVVLYGIGKQLNLNAWSTDKSSPYLQDTLQVTIKKMFSIKPEWELWLYSEYAQAKASGAYVSGQLDGKFNVSGVWPVVSSWGQFLDINIEGNLGYQKNSPNPLAIDIPRIQSKLVTSTKDTVLLSAKAVMSKGVLEASSIVATNSRNEKILGEAFLDLKSFNWNAAAKSEKLSIRFNPKNSVQIAHADIKGSGHQNMFDVHASLAGGKGSLQIGGGDLNVGVVNSLLTYSKDSTDTQPKLAGRVYVENLLYQSKLMDFKMVMSKLMVWNQKKSNKRSQPMAKKSKPLDVNIRVSTLGSNNRIHTDVVKSAFSGDIQVDGTTPYLLFTGEINAISGEFGLSSQVYQLNEFSLSWQDDVLEEGSLSLVGEKTVASSCQPNNPDSCNVQLILTGELGNPQFNYGGSCSGELGESVEPVDVITSVGRGCFGTQGTIGDAGRDMVGVLFDKTLSDWVSKSAKRFVGVIEQIKVSGTGNLVRDNQSDPNATTADKTSVAAEKENAFSVQVTSNEYKGFRLLGQYKYFTGQEYADGKELSGGLQWRPPLDRVSNNSTWRHRVKDRVKVESLVKSPPVENNTEDQDSKNLRLNLDLGYQYDFWEIW